MIWDSRRNRFFASWLNDNTPVLFRHIARGDVSNFYLTFKFSDWHKRLEVDKCGFEQLHAGRRLFAMAIINACNRVGGLTRLSRARHSSVVEVTHKNCKEQRRCFSHLWCSFSKPQDRQGDWCSVQGRRLHFWRFPFPIFCPCFFLSSSLWGIKKRQGKKVENLGTKSDEQASNDPAWMSKVQKPLCLIHFWVIPFLPFSAIAPYSLWGNKKLVLPVWKFKSLNFFGTKSAKQAANGPVWMPQGKKPLSLIHFWVIPFPPFSAIAPSSLWGNKKLVLPVWKFKRLIFLEQNQLNRQMVQFECPNVRNPCISFFFGDLTFSQFLPLLLPFFLKR